MANVFTSKSARIAAATPFAAVAAGAAFVAEASALVGKKVAGEKKIPANLLTGETEEACAEQADAILAFAQPGGYPRLRDAGEPSRTSTAQTRDRFADWAKDNL